MDEHLATVDAYAKEQYEAYEKQLAMLRAELEACRLAVNAPKFGPDESLSAYLEEWAKASTERAEIATLKQQLAESETNRKLAIATIESLHNYYYACERAEAEIGNEESER